MLFSRALFLKLFFHISKLMSSSANTFEKRKIEIKKIFNFFHKDHSYI